MDDAMVRMFSMSGRRKDLFLFWCGGMIGKFNLHPYHPLEGAAKVKAIGHFWCTPRDRPV
jgi:hypothetical protein